LSPFFRGSCRRFLLLLWPDADLLQKWMDRLFAAQELFDRNVDVTSIARLIDLAAQFHTGLFVEVAVLRFFKNGRHVGCDRIGPRVAVVTRIVAIEMSKVGNKRGAWINWQKDFFQDRIRYGHAIVRQILGVLIVQSKIQRCKCELASIKNTS